MSLVKWLFNNCIQSYAVALTVWLSLFAPPFFSFSTSRHCSLVRWLWTVKHLSKCLLRMRKTFEKHSKITNPVHICLWRMTILEAVCQHDLHNVRSNIFFLISDKNVGLCAMTFTLKCMFVLTTFFIPVLNTITIKGFVVEWGTNIVLTRCYLQLGMTDFL